MYFVAFHINSTERTRRTEVFASTTTDATFGIHYRNLQRLLVVRILRNHLDSTSRTMAGTVAALLTIAVHDTVFSHPYGVTNLDSSLFFLGNWLDSTSRTYFRTLSTFRTTISTFVRCFRMHEVVQTSRRTENLVWTSRDSQLASRTMLSQVLCTEGSRRSDRSFTLRNMLVFNGSETTVHFQLLSLGYTSTRDNH